MPKIHETIVKGNYEKGTITTNQRQNAINITLSSNDQTNLRVMWRKVWLGRFSLDMICNISQTRGEAAGYKNTFSSILQHWRAALVALKKCLVLGALRLTAYTARLCNFSWMRKSEFWRLFAFSRVFSINHGKIKVNWKLFSCQKLAPQKRWTRGEKIELCHCWHLWSHWSHLLSHCASQTPPHTTSMGSCCRRVIGGWAYL